jgi:hypothetical protein
MECYNCGKEVSKKDSTLTREHIPAQNLFAGYGDEYKKNRIVVPSCKTCNNGSHKVDEEFRNLIGTISERDDLGTISKNTAKSIINRNKQFDRLLIEQGKVKGVKFNEKLVLDNHIKIFKGLFYHQYGKPIGLEYKIVATINPTNFTGSCVNYLMNTFDFKFSGHPDIFKYILQPFREGVNNPSKQDLEPDENEGYFVCLIEYNKSHAAMVLATNKDLVKKAS